MHRLNLLTAFLFIASAASTQVLPTFTEKPQWHMNYQSAVVVEDNLWRTTLTEYEELPTVFFDYLETIGSYEYAHVQQKGWHSDYDCFIRQELDKAFLLCPEISNDEVLLYDFSLELDATFNASKLNGYSRDLEFLSTTMKVIRKEVVNNRIELTLEAEEDWFRTRPSKTMKWIEGIGSEYGPIYPMFSGMGILHSEVQCLELPNNIVFEDEKNDSCGFKKFEVTPFNGTLVRLYAYPTLSNNGEPIYLNVSYSSRVPSEFDISLNIGVFDAKGRLVRQVLSDLKNAVTIDGLESGMYLVRALNKEITAPAIKLMVN